jgi:hypothetical protein
MMCIHKNDYSYLINGYETLSESVIYKFVKSNAIELKTTFEKIQKEYEAITFNKRELNKQKELATMMLVETQHNTIVKIVNLYLECNDATVLKILNELGVPFDESKPINKQLEKANLVAMGLRNSLNIKTLNFKKKYRISEEGIEAEKERYSEDVEKSLDAQALIIENNLETGYRIDVKKTSVLRWVNLLETNQAKLDKQNAT